MMLLQVSVFVYKLRTFFTTTARRRAIRCLSFAPLVLVSTFGCSSILTPLTNPAPSTIQLMMQLTDGSVLVQSYNGQTWMKLTPDATGSYINGTWSLLAASPTPRLYFASQVLPDGRVFVVGGE